MDWFQIWKGVCQGCVVSPWLFNLYAAAAAAAAKSPQSCLTLCDPIDSSPPGCPIPGFLQAKTLEWVAISFSSAWKWTVKVKSASRVRLLAAPWTAAYQAPPSMYTTYKLIKQGDNIQPWCSPFLIWNQSIVPCPVLTVASWASYRFLRRQIRWSGIPISWRIFQFVVIHTVKGFGVFNEIKVVVFSELSCFLYDPVDVGNLISGSSAFTKSSLSICKFWVHVLLLKASLKNFENFFASMWDECNCVVVWTFFGIAFLCDWNENWPFPVLWLLLSFPNLLAYWVQHFHSIIF